MQRKKCICKICQCGRHKCPHLHPKQITEGFSKATEYTDHFISHNCQRQKLIKQQSTTISHTEPISNKTTHRSDFVLLPLEPRKPKKPQTIYITEGKFDGTSVYNSEFTEKGLVRVNPVKPHQHERILDKFVGEATYKTDYKEWDVEPRQSCGPKNDYQKPSAQFKGEASYTTDYIDHGVVKPLNCFRPPIVPLHSAPFDATTTFKADYVPKHAEKLSPFRPNAKSVDSGEPFSKETTHRVDYTKWPLPEHYRHVTDDYKPNVGEFDDRTTYATNYVPLDGERAKMLKPAPQIPDPNREFSDLTNYKKEYRKWSIKERPAPTYGLPKYSPPESAFEGETIYQSEYIGKQPNPCPVTLLQSDPDIVYEGEDEDGHEFYWMRNQKKKKKPSATAVDN